MRKFYILFLLILSYPLTAQTFDFQNVQDQFGWVSGGGCLLYTSDAADE